MLVNPVGGKGKARAIVKDSVLPMLEAAGCIVTIMGKSSGRASRAQLKYIAETTHRLHAEEIARELDLDSGFEWVSSLLRMTSTDHCPLIAS
jgi:sphingosine kinase